MHVQSVHVQKVSNATSEDRLAVASSACYLTVQDEGYVIVFC